MCLHSYASICPHLHSVDKEIQSLRKENVLEAVHHAGKCEHDHWVPVLDLTCCVIMGNSGDFSVPFSLTLKGMIMVPTPEQDTVTRQLKC